MKISPSLLASDFANLEAESIKVINAGADMLHMDVMDGNFVPNITIGACVLKSLSKKVDAFYDVHLMIDDPYRYIDDFVDAGADLITFHVEACENVQAVIDKIKQAGKKVGLSLRPKTSLDEIYKFLDVIDLVLVMSVEPGFGGQAFIEESLDRVASIKNKIKDNNLNVEIEVDGGLNQQNAKFLKNAGADILVAGSFIFNSDDYFIAINKLKNQGGYNEKSTKIIYK